MITRSPHVGGEVDLVQADGGTISQQQRRERIRREVLAHGRVRIESLVEQYGAGGMPIRDMAEALCSDVLFLPSTTVVDGRCLHRPQESVQVE